MKNMLFIVGIGVLIIGMPLATALSTPTMTYSKPVMKLPRSKLRGIRTV
jgi:hypothetical protein